MRLYLHIGTHKTGTTAVQQFLAANRARLRDAGVVYPRSGSPPRRSISHGQHALAWALTRPEATKKPVWDKLRAELAEAPEDVAVISSEEFDLLRDDEQFSALASHLEDLEVKVVVYLRRQDEFLNSYYCTDVLFHGETRDFHEYATAPRTDANYQTLLAPWEEAFGREALIVRPYGRSSLTGGDIVADVGGVVGFDPGAEGFERPPRQHQINRAYPRNVINCVLLARRMGMPDDQVVLLRRMLFLAYRNYPTRSDYLAPPDREALLARYEDSNRTVARRYLGRDSLFDDLEPGDPEDWARRYEGELADFISSLDLELIAAVDADLASSLDDPKQTLAGLGRSGGGAG